MTEVIQEKRNMEDIWTYPDTHV